MLKNIVQNGLTSLWRESGPCEGEPGTGSGLNRSSPNWGTFVRGSLFRHEFQEAVAIFGKTDALHMLLLLAISELCQGFWMPMILANAERQSEHERTDRNVVCS